MLWTICSTQKVLLLPTWHCKDSNTLPHVKTQLTVKLSQQRIPNSTNSNTHQNFILEYFPAPLPKPNRHKGATKLATELVQHATSCMPMTFYIGIVIWVKIGVDIGSEAEVRK